MANYYFRVQFDEKISYIGAVTGIANKKELYWALDEFCDPNDCDLIRGASIGFCVKVETGSDEELEASEQQIVSDIELGQHTPMPDDPRWKKAVWPDLSTLYGGANV